MSEKTGDVVLTPDWVAEDMIRHFSPSGSVLDPCRGPLGEDGVFWSRLGGRRSWCEVSDGRDFFSWSEHVDWVIGNPPYSLTRKWFRHSYSIADHLLYLVPLRNVFSGYGFLREISEFGGLREIRTYGTGGRLGFPMGNAVGAMHLERDWRGPCVMSDFDEYETGLI